MLTFYVRPGGTYSVHWAAQRCHTYTTQFSPFQACTWRLVTALTRVQQLVDVVVLWPKRRAALNRVQQLVDVVVLWPKRRAALIRVQQLVDVVVLWPKRRAALTRVQQLVECCGAMAETTCNCFDPVLHTFRKCCALRITRLRALVHPIRLAASRWRWVWNVGGIIVTGENWSSGRTRQAAMYVWRNIEACSCNRCCTGKAINVTYCVCSLRYPVSNAHAPYCHLWPVRLCRIFPHYVLNGTIFEEKKKSLNTKYVSIFSTFVCKISRSEKKWPRCDKKCVHVFTSSGRYSFQVLINLEFCRQVFETYSYINVISSNQLMHILLKTH